MTKIGIIEDDQTIAQMYRMKFEADGYDVQLANNGKRGIEMAEEFLPDILLLDLNMPEMNGTEALTFLRKQEWGKDIPVIILTNLGQEEAPKELKELNVRSYIVKAELTPRQVVSRVQEILEK